MVRSRTAITLLAGVLVLFGASKGKGQGTAAAPGPRLGAPIEGVIAVVGDKSILRSEVEEQFQMLAPQFQVDPADTSQANQLRREILDNLVSEHLLNLEAETQGIKVDDAEVKAAVEQAIEGDRARLGAEGFATQLMREGITETDLRARYSQEAKSEMMRRQLLQREIFSKIQVTDAQVEKYFRDNKEKIGRKSRALRVLDLYLRVTPDSTIERTHRSRAEQIRGEILGGLAFDVAAKNYSDDERSRDSGGLLGRFGPGDLGDRSFEGVAFTLPVGEISAPIRTNLGYHIVQVMDRDPEGRWAQIRHILIRVLASRADESRTRGEVERLREQIVSKSISFEDAVRRHSDDPASREAGGDVGWLAIDNFLGETRGAVENLRVGEVSPVAAVEGGFHIFKLIGEQAETEYTFAEIKDELTAMVQREEQQTRLETYIGGLRKKSFVDIRPLR